MGKLRPSGLLIAAILGLACGDRTLPSDEAPVEPLCLFASGTMGTRVDGTSSRLVYPGAGGGTPYVCTCVTEEQFWDEAEIERLEEELSDLLLEECEWVADAQGFVSNDCQEYHDLELWLGWSFLALGQLDLPNSCGNHGWVDESEPQAPSCMLGEPGCSCTVEATCMDGATCVDGMCQLP